MKVDIMKMKNYKEYLKKYQELCRTAEITKDAKEFNTIFVEIDNLENDNPEFCDMRLGKLVEEMKKDNNW